LIDAAAAEVDASISQEEAQQGTPVVLLTRMSRRWDGSVKLR